MLRGLRKLAKKSTQGTLVAIFPATQCGENLDRVMDWFSRMVAGRSQQRRLAATQKRIESPLPAHTARHARPLFGAQISHSFDLPSHFHVIRLRAVREIQ